jgi:hypothetical protein
LPQFGAIGAQCRLDPAAAIQSTTSAGYWRQIALWELLPHLFLRATHYDDMAGKAAAPTDHPPAKVEKLVDRG